jgi:hypothetical protein
VEQALSSLAQVLIYLLENRKLAVLAKIFSLHGAAGS